MWYAAHFLTGHIKAGSSDQDVIVEETISLIEALGPDEAYEKAKIISEQYALTSIGYFDPWPTRIKSYGVIKVVEISNPDLGNEEAPGDKSEISYNLYKFSSEEDVSNFTKEKRFSARVWRPE